MNDPHFTGRLVGNECQEYKKKDETMGQCMVIRLQTDERSPMVLPLKLSRQMYDELMSLQPTMYSTIITAYLGFRVYVYEKPDEGVLREGVDIYAWRLEVTLPESGEVYTINRRF